MSLSEEMGQRILHLRQKQRISQRALADSVGGTPSTVSGWEAGRRRPEGEMLLKLAQALGTSVSYLFGETDDPRPAPDWYSNRGPGSADDAAKEQVRALLKTALEKLD